MLGHGAGIGYTGPGWAPLTLSVWWRGRIARDALNGNLRSLKVIRFYANRRGIYDFLLALNTNLTISSTVL